MEHWRHRVNPVEPVINNSMKRVKRRYEIEIMLSVARFARYNLAVELCAKRLYVAIFGAPFLTRPLSRAVDTELFAHQTLRIIARRDALILLECSSRYTGQLRPRELTTSTNMQVEYVYLGNLKINRVFSSETTK